VGEIGFVLAVTLVTWVGLFFYMVRVDLKLREAERREEI
jgi:CcmD family protein